MHDCMFSTFKSFPFLSLHTRVRVKNDSKLDNGNRNAYWKRGNCHSHYLFPSRCLDNACKMETHRLRNEIINLECMSSEDSTPLGISSQVASWTKRREAICTSIIASKQPSEYREQWLFHFISNSPRILHVAFHCYEYPLDTCAL